MQKRAIVDLASLKKLQEKNTALTRLESFPYSEDLSSVMDPNLFTCRPEQSIQEIVRELARRSISSALIVDLQGHPIGILTEKDILRRIATAGNIDIASTPVSAVMSTNLTTLRPDDTVYHAMSVLSAGKIKHLPVLDKGLPVGIVTFRRLLKLRYPEPMTLIEGIRSATTIEELKAIKDRLPEAAATKLSMGIQAHDIVVMLSLINQDIHCRAFELALREKGEPPAPVCLYVTGSHGRMENLLSPDQDHGMLIADSPDRQVPYLPYWAELTGLYVEWLDRIGFETCRGYVMSVNPLWRKSVNEWKEQIQYWFDRQVRELGRYVTVLFDARPIFGENHLFEEVMGFACNLLSKHHEVLRVLHEEESRHRPPTGLLGRFITERHGEHQGEMDIKRSGLLFMVEGIRILALHHGVWETSTLKRIQGLVEGGFIHQDDGEYFTSAYHYLLHLALTLQVKKSLAGDPVNTYLNPGNLTKLDKETLRHAFKAVGSLQELVASDFGQLVI